MASRDSSTANHRPQGGVIPPGGSCGRAGLRSRQGDGWSRTPRRNRASREGEERPSPEKDDTRVGHFVQRRASRVKGLPPRSDRADK
jgi:hypothetical protein